MFAIFPEPSRESPPMFDTRFIDRFSRTHWSVVPILFVPAALYCFYRGTIGAPEGQSVSVLMGLGCVALGILAWTLMEYWLHRELFHWQPAGKFGERMHFVLHGVHHKWPRDQYRLVMPPAVSISLFFLFLWLWQAVLGRFGLAFHAGFTVGYMFYDMGHYYMHHGHPSSEWMRRLRKHHMVHHSPKLEHEKKFGVSTTLWDHVFRTYGGDID
jgi:sterol desaturase/sphingolipid hydroxylase (fatty acid hydroxylase superfamily)